MCIITALKFCRDTALKINLPVAPDFFTLRVSVPQKKNKKNLWSIMGHTEGIIIKKKKDLPAHVMYNQISVAGFK